MSSWRPTVDAERAMAFRRSMKSELPDEVLARLQTGWSDVSLVARVVFFCLTALGVGALFGLFALFDIPLKGWLTAILACGLGEILIRKSRFFASGAEEALWLGGLCAIIVGLKGSPSVDVLLLFSAALLVAGWRVLNSLFPTVAIILLCVWFGAKADASEAAGMALLFAALAASVVIMLPIRRPWNQGTAALSVMVLPLGSWIAFSTEGPRFGVSTPELVLFSGLAVWLLIWGLRKRSHPLLASGMIAIGFAGADVADRLLVRTDVVLTVCGAVILIVSLVVDRILRRPRRGITSSKLRDEDDLGLLEIGATTVLAGSAPELAPGRKSGGEFGGAGASGDY